MKIRWRNSIGARLAGITFLMLVLALALMVANLWMLDSLADGARWVDAAGQQRVRTYQVVTLVDRLDEGDAQQRAEVRSRLLRLSDEIPVRLAQLRRGEPSEDLPGVASEVLRERLSALEVRWRDELQPVVDAIMNDDASADPIVAGLPVLRERARAFATDLDRLLALYREELDDANALYRWLNIAFGLVALGVFVVVSWIGHRTLYQRMRRLTVAAEAIAGGELAHAVPQEGGDEVAAVGHAIAGMTHNLRHSLDETATQAVRLRGVLDSTPDAIVTIDTHGTILQCNRATTGLFGFSADEMLGRNVSMLMPSPYREEHDSYLERYLRTGVRRIIGREREVRGLRKGGEVFPMSLWVSELRHGDERLFIGVVRDITVLKQRNAERERILQTVTRTVQRVASASSQIVAAVTQQATSAQEQAAAVTESLSTVHEVTETASQAAERARGVADSARRSEELGRAGQRAVERSIDTMEAARTTVESTAERILDLSEQAQAIGSIITTVNDIAERTNLLALNAGIEASRAGEHGRGFAVVASEVKALADRAKEATAQVRTILLDIQKATNSAVLVTEDGTRRVAEAMQNVTDAGQTIDGLTRLLSKAVEAASQISASAGQQAAGLSQVDEAMEQMRSATHQTLGATRELEGAARDLNGLAEELNALLELDETALEPEPEPRPRERGS